MFSVITNIYNKKTKGPTLVELFTDTGKLIFFLQLEMFDVCTTGDTAHLNIVSMCVVSPVKNIFSFPVAVKNSIKVGPLVFLLYMFVMTENIMKRSVLYKNYL